MKARMEKYDVDTTVKSRTSRHENLYTEVGSMNIDYVDIDVDNAVELNPTPTGKTSREDFQKQRELNKILPSNKEKSYEEANVVEPKEDRVYDINEILSMARKNKLFEEEEKKRLINTEYNILTKLDVGQLENEEMKKEDLKVLINDIYEKEKPKKPERIKKYSRSEEAKLLSDLFEEDEEPKFEEGVNIQEELSKEILDKEEPQEETPEESEETVATQITTEVEIKEDTAEMYDFGIEKKKDKKKKESQNMLEGIDLKQAKEQDEMDDEYEEKEGKALIVAIIIVVILILACCGFFLYEYFIGL